MPSHDPKGQGRDPIMFSCSCCYSSNCRCSSCCRNV